MIRFPVFILLAAFAATACQPSSSSEDQQQKSDWPTTNPEAAGIYFPPLDSLIDSIALGKYGHVDALFLVQGGKLVLDTLFQNDYRAISRGKTGVLGCGWESCPDSTYLQDYNYYHPTFHPYYRGSELHTLQSVTKSVAATLIGVALRRGDIPSLDLPLLSFFDEMDPNQLDPRLSEATLRDLLQMRLGIEWHETDRPIDSTNTTFQLEISDDWVQFTFDQPMDAAPGEKWAYNSGASHLMSAIIHKATGQYIDDYAEKHLFGPLGINDYYWKKAPKGYPDTEGGLFLRTSDLAKIGQLYLQDGQWEGKQITPAGWAEEATRAYSEEINALGWGYGYQWWRLDQIDHEVWAGLGFGGQYLLVIPSLDLVAVVNSWNIFDQQVAFLIPDLLDVLIRSAQTGKQPSDHTR